MTKKIMFLLTASILSLGIMTGCSGNSGNTQSDNGNNAVSQADTRMYPITAPTTRPAAA